MLDRGIRLKAVNESCLNTLDFLQKYLAIENRASTNEVRLRGLYAKPLPCGFGLYSPRLQSVGVYL